MQGVNGSGGTNMDWKAISRHPKFVELHDRKKRFLVGWWLFSAIFYFALPIGAAYAGSIFKIRVIGVLNLGYLFAFAEFLMAWGVALHYANVANKEFDRLTRELVEELTAGGK